jgi:hypothetical protein
MRRSVRWTAVLLLFAGLPLASPGVAADLDGLLREFNVSPAGLKPAPTFSLKTIEGRAAVLADQRGRTVLLYFWATW